MQDPAQPKFGFTHCLRLCFVLLLMMIGLFFYYVWSEKQIDPANEKRYTARMLTDELRQSSDDMTRMIRSYVITGDDVFLRYYEEIIDIRDGKRPRPSRYHSSYWDFVDNDVAGKAVAENTAIPLLELMKQAQFSDDELSLLTEAKIESDKLVETERQAVQLVQSSTNDATNSARQRALMMVFDHSYNHQKAQIMKLIDQATLLAEKRTRSAVEDATQWAFLMRMALIFLGSILLCLILLCEKLFLSTLGAKPESIYQHIRWLGTGNFDSLPPPTNVPPNSVISHLVQTQKRLKELDKQRKQSHQSLQLMSKVFSEAQEGIFLTDAQGIVFDVNLAYLCITGLRRKECIGKYARVLASNQHTPDFYTELWTQINSEHHWRGEIWDRQKNGKLFAGILNFSAVFDDDGHLLCYLGMLTDITQLKTHQQEIEELAFHDALTSLPNRLLLADRMQQAHARVQRNNEILAVACLDLDGFKAVNDSYGHSAGDDLLVEVSKRLVGCVRSGDTVARLGGDEFAILLCGIESREQIENTLNRILHDLASPYHVDSHPITSISGSMGYTVFPEDNADPDTLLRHADQAMYIAKQAGKNRSQRFDIHQDKRIQANWVVLARIENALKNRELILYVQPKINLQSGKVVGAEALIRWQHPIRGLILPGEFLPLTENSDVSIGIGEWAIQEALQIMRDWRSKGLSLPLSVNISARQIRQRNFCERLIAILECYPDVPPDQLEIEIIESAAIDDLQKVSHSIARCKALGISFALDDFGTGYSSLTYLKRLSVAALKIDQSFVHDLLEDESDLAIVRGVIGLAQAFNTEIIAEGLENWQQAECLVNMGCFVAQGYAIAHPMPPNDLPEWITQFRMPESIRS